MRRLVPLLDPQGMVLGVTDVDLFVPDSPFVFGEADRESRVAILSVARLRQGADEVVLRRRVQIQGLHQAGHLVGSELLRGCPLRDVRRDLAGRRRPSATGALPHLPQRAGKARSLRRNPPRARRPQHPP